MISRRFLCIQLALASLLLGGCSVKKLAMNQLGDALSGGGDVFASDEDPELVGDALPFSLKLMESILAETPEHVGLLTSLSSGFTQYAYGWVQLDADEIEDEDYDRAEELRDRAIKLYQRANRYGMRGLEVKYPGLGEALKENAKAALQRVKKEDVETLYWAALSWAGAISLSLDNMDLVGDLAYVEAMMLRCLELDPDWEMGSIQSFFITYEMSRMNGEGDPVENATRYFKRALELSEGKLASVYVAYAESVAVEQQDKELFLAMLNKALEIDVDANPSLRLNNLLYQRRAEWLLTRLDWLFL
ncbi:TRAP transporter TatT component family protein [Pelagicoccus sp. SDUM812005]|uniref:TRAP transporter TatT component family protein n=1 Tax=Pelagicoccus sp. SDUM812005 TaxID=3041257 RepID=UPI00280F367A|nr:TRAP transporter TatT component family protein [Pelagicoccus sp. SDUM812005]MDQ8181335.1 TRAP transporter TatT component family protein [Pelagicoccus sp. SDUM812005]